MDGALWRADGKSRRQGPRGSRRRRRTEARALTAGVGPKRAGALGLAARARRRRGGWPRRGSRGLGASSGVFRAVLRTRPWVSRRRGSTRRRCTQRGGLTAARDSSGEQSREQQSSNDQIKGAGGLLALRGSAGVTEQRRRRKDATGRLRRGSDCARIALVSADRTKQRGKGTPNCVPSS